MTSYARNASNFVLKVLDNSGNEITIRDSDYLVTSLEYKDSDKKTDTLTLTVNNYYLENFDHPTWKPGNKVIVSWGYPGFWGVPRLMLIKKVSGSVELKVECKGLEVLLSQRSAPRDFNNMSRSQIAVQIADEMGFGEDMIHVQPTEEVFDTLSKTNVPMATFLRRHASREGYIWYIDHTGFHFHEADYLQTSAKTYRWFTDQEGGDVLKFDFEDHKSLYKPKRVRVACHHSADGKRCVHTSDNEKDKDRAVISPEVDDDGEGQNAGSTTRLRYVRDEQAGFLGSTGATSLATSEVGSGDLPEAFLGEEASAVTALISGLTNQDTNILSEPSAALSPKDAKIRAQAAFRRSQRKKIKLKMTCVGDPHQLAKSIIRFEGIGTRLSGLYYVSEVTHKISPSGVYLMDMTMYKDGHNGYQQPRNGNGLPVVGRLRQRGRQNTDPARDKRNRNKSMHNQEETVQRMRYVRDEQSGFLGSIGATSLEIGESTGRIRYYPAGGRSDGENTGGTGER